MTFGVVIQCRDESSRYLRKCVRPFAKDGKSILEVIIHKFSHLGYPIIINTTVDSLETIDQAVKAGVEIVYHTPPNVLEGFIEAAINFNLSGIFRVCADNPLVQLGLLGPLRAWAKSYKFDYISYKDAMYRHEGFFLEYISRVALDYLKQADTTEYEKEHVTTHIRNNPLFRTKTLDVPWVLDKLHIRLTVDTRDDFLVAKDVYDNVGNLHWFQVLSYACNNKKIEEQMLKNIKANPK